MADLPKDVRTMFSLYLKPEVTIEHITWLDYYRRLGTKNSKLDVIFREQEKEDLVRYEHKGICCPLYMHEDTISSVDTTKMFSCVTISSAGITTQLVFLYSYILEYDHEMTDDYITAFIELVDAGKYAKMKISTGKGEYLIWQPTTRELFRSLGSFNARGEVASRIIDAMRDIPRQIPKGHTLQLVFT